MSLDRFDFYKSELEKKLEKEKEQTIRHMYFLIKTTKPNELNDHVTIRNLWDKTFKLQADILNRLCMQAVHFQHDNVEMVFSNVSNDGKKLWHYYLTHIATNMSLNCLETILNYHQTVNAHLKTIIDLCFLEHLLHHPEEN